jgi:glycine/D-amino acid oxidase-like deaminating enzyme
VSSTDRLKGARVVVIGAGAIGSVVALRVAQAGAAVNVIEGRHVASGATYGSFAWTNAFGKGPREYFALNMRGMREHEALAAELRGDWLHADGALAWVHASDDDTHFQHDVELSRGWGYRVDEIEPERVTRELEPDLRIDPHEVELVYRMPLEGWVEATRMCQAALRGAIRLGAELVEGRVTSLLQERDVITGVVVGDGRALTADLVVNAAGPEAGEVARLAGLALPMERSPGAVIVTQPIPVTLRHVVHPGGYHHPTRASFRPDGGGRVMLHSPYVDSFAGSERPPVPGDPVLTRTIEGVASVLPALRFARTEACRVGVRPVPQDRLPIVGRDPRVAGLYHAVTHSGVTLAAIIARLVTDDLSGQDMPDLAPFRIERFDGIRAERPPESAAPE